MLRGAALLCTAVLGMSCAGTLGYPRHLFSLPSECGAAAEPVVEESVRLVTSPADTFDFDQSSAGATLVARALRLDLDAEELPVGAGAATCELRSADFDMALLATVRGPSRLQTWALTRAALKDLQARAARRGVHRVFDARCFLSELPMRRVWCEGLARLSEASP